MDSFIRFLIFLFFSLFVFYFIFIYIYIYVLYYLLLLFFYTTTLRVHPAVTRLTVYRRFYVRLRQVVRRAVVSGVIRMQRRYDVQIWPSNREVTRRAVVSRVYGCRGDMPSESDSWCWEVWCTLERFWNCSLSGAACVHIFPP